MTPGRITAAVLLSLLALLAGSAIWIAREYHHDLTRARTRVESGSQVVSTPCGSIEYGEVGAGPPILIIHGAGGGFDQGLALGASLAANGYRVIAISRFGYLRTPAPPGATIARQAAAHACVLDALGINRAAVIGVSAGAPSALEFALRYPARCDALVLQVPGWYPLSNQTPRRFGAIQARLFDRFLRSDLLFWAMTRFMPATSYRVVLGTPPPVVEAADMAERLRMGTILTDILPVSRRHIGLALEPALTVARLSAPLESISVPTLAISAKDDLYETYSNAEYIAARIPHARFIHYQTGGHMLIGHDAEVISEVLAFLRANGGSLRAHGGSPDRVRSIDRRLRR